MKDTLTIVMPTSPIPSHPSTEVIEESIRRLRVYPDLKDCEILIQIEIGNLLLQHSQKQTFTLNHLVVCVSQNELCAPSGPLPLLLHLSVA